MHSVHPPALNSVSRAPKAAARKLFRLLNHVAAVVQAAGARQFGQIQRRIGKGGQQRHMPLMPWCMKRGGMSRRVCMQRREKRRFPLRHNCAG